MFLAVDEDGDEYIFGHKPKRYDMAWDGSVYIEVPKGTIERLLNYPLTWDDDCQEIVEYKDKDLKEDKVIKQNIKMRVTPEQSKKVQEICFENGIYWPGNKNTIQSENQKYLYINDGHITFGDTYEYFEKYDAKEIDAALFIRTNGTCENEITLKDDDVARILKASKDQPIEYLRQKIVNLYDQLNKNRKTVQNQKEEITRLLSQKEDLQNRLNISNKTVGISINNGIDLVKYLEEKDAIIKYLENKLEI